MNCRECEAFAAVAVSLATFDGGAVEAEYEELRRALSRLIWGEDSPPGGRGKTLEARKDGGRPAILKLQKNPGTVPDVPYAEAGVQKAKAWTDHLVEDGLHARDEVEQHLLGNDNLPDERKRALARGFLGVEGRFQALREAEAELEYVEAAPVQPRRRDREDAIEEARRARHNARRGLRSNEAAYEALLSAAASDNTPDSVRKARDRSPSSLPEAPRDWPGPPVPEGAPRILFDFNELAHRHPEVAAFLQPASPPAGPIPEEEQDRVDEALDEAEGAIWGGDVLDRDDP